MVLDILETVLSLPIVTFQIVACCFSYINSVANILCRHVYPDFSFLSFYLPCSFFDTVTQQENAMEKGFGKISRCKRFCILANVCSVTGYRYYRILSRSHSRAIQISKALHVYPT